MSHPVDLETLRAVLAVAECASYTRAAQRLGVTQPAISRRIVQMETALRTHFFRREGHRFLLTEAGEAVCERARAMIEIAESLPKAVHELSGKPAGTLSIGVPPALGEILLPRLVSIYRQKYPDVFLRIWHGHSADLAQMLTDKQIDVAVMYGKPQTNAIALTPLLNHQLGLVVPKAWKVWPGTKRRIEDRISVRDAAALPLMMSSDSVGMRELVEEAMTSIGEKLRLDMEVNSSPLAKSLVRAGLGCMFLASSGLRGRTDRSTLRFVHVENPTINWTLYLSIRKFGRPALATSLLIPMIAATVRDLVRDGEWQGELLC